MFVLDELAQLREYYHRAGFSTGYWTRLTEALGYWLDSRGNAPVLNEDLTLTVDSATGDDDNAGTADQPFATLQRALDERAKYGAIRAAFTIELKGAGPYTMTKFDGSVCTGNGSFTIAGDPTAVTATATGTFAGSFSGTTTVTTSAGLGTDTHYTKFLRVTSGALTGAVFQIVAHTDAAITVSANYSTTAIADVSNGDTFEIFEPNTVINVTGDEPDFFTLSGGAGQSLGPLTGIGTTRPAHNLRYLRLVSTNLLYFVDATLSAEVVTLQASRSWYTGKTAFMSGGDPNTPLYFGAGIQALPYSGAGTQQLFVDWGGQFFGFVGHKNTFASLYAGFYSTAIVQLLGGRYYLLITQSGQLYVSALANTGQTKTIASNITLQRGGTVAITQAVEMRANTSYAMFQIFDDSSLTVSADITGQSLSTNPAMLFRGSGACVFRVTPVMLGSTPGQDIKLPNLAAIDASTLSTSGTGALDPTTGARVARY